MSASKKGSKKALKKTSKKATKKGNGDTNALAMKRAIRAGVSRGVPLYRKGDIPGCTKAYRAVVTRFAPVETVFDQALEACKTAPGGGGDNAKVWVLRRAMDAVYLKLHHVTSPTPKLTKTATPKAAASKSSKAEVKVKRKKRPKPARISGPKTPAVSKAAHKVSESAFPSSHLESKASDKKSPSTGQLTKNLKEKIRLLENGLVKVRKIQQRQQHEWAELQQEFRTQLDLAIGRMTASPDVEKLRKAKQMLEEKLISQEEFLEIKKTTLNQQYPFRDKQFY